MITAERTHTVFPDEEQIAAAAESSRQIEEFLSSKNESQRIELVDQTQQRVVVELPTFALRLLGDILIELASGNAVRLVPVHAELTTQEGADLLNVSRPHLVKLLEAGQLPHTKTGKHRRVKLADLMSYKGQRDQAGREAINELVSQAQKLGMGYE
ncbi:helix-turn-helix domain-containing protein [Halopseudomonas laoshanensis]|jgi:excisionase family DNA binding protein|uniref:helix-turn-helix domain-containing protein n=1 Tax=Halopseudomonas TaxID=2901189 RepID=UPI003736CFAB